MFVRSRLFDRFASARALLGLVVVLLALPAFADDGAVRLSTFDTVALADGRKTVTVTAIVTDHAGRYVPDGTIIRFETDLGQFKNPTVATINGLARAFLTAPTFAGTAHVKASAFPTLNASADLSIEFVSNRSLLESAKDYIEIVAPKYLMYSTELRTVEAAGEGREVEVRYRDIEIEAAHVQVNIPMYEVRARKAILRIGKVEREFDQLYIRLHIRQGLGTTVYEDDTPRVSQQPPFVWVDQEKRMRLGTMEISGGEFLPYTSTAPPNQFVFANLSNSVTLISAKKAVAFPSREIQFHRADLMVGGAKVMKVPLFQISAVTNSPIVTDQFLNVTSNQVAIDYPHYLSLKPGETSLLRFRTGTRYGSGVGATRGTSLDYELHWNRGGDSEGGLVVSGLLRKDWGVGLRHGLKLDDRTSASAQVDFPAHSSMFGTAQVSRQFEGFNASATASMGKTLTGTPYQNQQYFMSLDKDPMRVGKMPLSFEYGLTASQIEYKSEFSSAFQNSVGVNSRLRMDTLALDRNSTLSASLNVGHLMGHNVKTGLTTGVTTSYSTRLNGSSSVTLTYDYLDDGFASTILGHHRISLQSYYNTGAMTFRFFGGKSLDLDRINASADMRLRLADWRLGFGYSLDQYLGNRFSDYSFLVGYRIGFREVGLSWSARTRRIGIELLGASF